MNVGLVLFGWLRRAGLIAPTDRVVRAMQWVATRLERFGTDLGGMVVDAVGDADGATVRRRWRLIAEAGDGPYIPGIAVRSVLRDMDRIAPGARACLAEVTSADAEAAIAALSKKYPGYGGKDLLKFVNYRFK